MITPALHFDSFFELLSLSEKHSRISPAVGIHPHEVKESFLESLTDNLESALSKLKAPILGETGLEAHYDFVPWDLQLASLRAHLETAQTHLVPIILHCRSAEESLYHELKKYRLPRGGVVHCFTGSWSWAQRFLDLGFHLGITGIVTFKKAADVAEVATKAPLERLLVETDGPYLAPIPHRGKTNFPAYIPLIVDKIGQLRGLDAREVARQTVDNTIKLFDLPELAEDSSV